MKLMTVVAALLISTSALAQWQTRTEKDPITQKETVFHELPAKTGASFIRYECQGTKVVKAFIHLDTPADVSRVENGILFVSTAFDAAPSSQAWQVGGNYNSIFIPNNKLQKVVNAHTFAIRYRDLYHNDSTLEFENASPAVEKPCNGS